MMNVVRPIATIAAMGLALSAAVVAKRAPSADAPRGAAAAVPAHPAPGPTTKPGPRGEPRRRVQSLVADEPGVVVEDVLIDAEWADVDAVRVKADRVTLRHCEIRNGRRDGVEVYAADVRIEACRIHGFLAGTFADQKDAHGVTGRPTRLTIRDCEIGLVSGDCLQFDPGRGPWTDVVVEHCRLYAAPLPADAAGFKRGESPGENALDTKQKAANPRSRITLRHCVFEGFAPGGPINNRAALNLKNHVEVTVEDCVFKDNEIAVRARGPAGDAALGGALVTLTDCAFHDAPTAVRAEDAIERLALIRPAFAATVGQKVRHVGGRPGKGFRLEDERSAPELRR